MEFWRQLMGIVAAIAFPAFLIRAIKAQPGDAATHYTVLSCISFGFVVYVLIASL